MKLKQLDLFGPIRQGVQISQKTVKYTPIDKLYDAFITLLAGADGLVGPCAGHTLQRCPERLSQDITDRLLEQMGSHSG
jgi:hypothetical protein